MKRLMQKAKGAHMAEYALILALIAIFLIAMVTFMRGTVATKFNDAGKAITAAK